MATEPQWLPGCLTIMASSHVTHVPFCLLPQVVLFSCFPTPCPGLTQPCCLLFCEPRSLDSSIPLFLAFLALSVSLCQETAARFSPSQHPAQATPSLTKHSAPVPYPLVALNCSSLRPLVVSTMQHCSSLQASDHQRPLPYPQGYAVPFEQRLGGASVLWPLGP